MTKLFAYSMMLLIGSLCSAQTIYQSTDKNGNPIFTDQPQPAATPIELQPVNTTPGTTPTSSNQSSAPGFAGYQKVAVAVTTPIPNGLAPVTVGITVQPQLRPGHSWQLLLDGSQVAQGQGTSATLEQMERGDHQFLLQVIDGSGNVISQSAPANVFVFWPGKNR